jgi:hypothetical protein
MTTSAVIAAATSTKGARNEALARRERATGMYRTF